MGNGEFEELEVIGRGSFGQIRKVRRKGDGQILVRKEISYKSMNQKEKAQLIAEFRILKSLVHPNIVQYLHHEHVAEAHMVYLYMEYCGGGDLAGLIRQCKEHGTRVSENLVWQIFTQLILALYRCHYNADPPPPGEILGGGGDVTPPPNPSTVILHRDIKPDNVFLDEDHQVKLGDFGLAKMLDEEHLLANTYVGTPYYMSPEVLMDQPSTPQSDIWSLGCVIYELCALHPPFQAKSHIALSQKIREGVFPPIPAIYSSTLSKTITACLSINPGQRPTTATLLTLDVIKLALRDREMAEMQRGLAQYEENLHAYEQALRDREEQLKREFEAHKERFEADIYRRLELHFTEVIEAEVDRRVRERLEALQRVSAAAPVSPGDASMSTPPHSVGGSSSNSNANAASNSANNTNTANAGNTTPRGGVRGPRSIRDSIISPLRESRQPFDDMSNHVFVPSSPLVRTAVDRSALERSSPTANWQTLKSASTPARAAAAGAGVRSAAAKARALGPAGGRSAVQLRPDSAATTTNGRMWDENIHGDDMPSPFLRKWERSEPVRRAEPAAWRLSQ